MKIVSEQDKHSWDKVSKLIWSAKVRSTLKPLVCLMLKDAEIEDDSFSIRSSIHIASIGMNVEFIEPNVIEEFESVASSSRMPPLTAMEAESRGG